MNPVLVSATDWSQSFWTNVFVPVAAAGVAAAVVVAGYLYERRNKRRDDLRALFSDAIEAIAEYQELPYLVRRRSDSSPMTPAELSARISSVQTRLDFFAARLSLEREEVGSSFRNLLGVVRSESGSQISEAWRSERLTEDSSMPLGASYPRVKGELAKKETLEIMQAYLR
ncbi:MAG TPA: hypothetical protein VM784_00530 [Actinomycetota bacterium]|nr:hypothetical protein [Actinomycetota bacterium]